MSNESETKDPRELWTPILKRKRVFRSVASWPQMLTKSALYSTLLFSRMYLLFVHPKHAGRGVGRTLLTAAHDVLRAAGCRQVFLYTQEQNKRTLAFYETAGYSRDGTIRESDFRGVRPREPRLVNAL